MLAHSCYACTGLNHELEARLDYIIKTLSGSPPRAVVEEASSHLELSS